MIYFIECGDFIKIGYAKRPKMRFQNIQVANPHKLKMVLVVAGEYADEARMHQRFAKHHHRGEWFHKNPEFMAEMQIVRAEFEKRKADQSLMILKAAMEQFKPSNSFQAMCKQ